MATTALVLLMNGHDLLFSSEEMVRFPVEIAQGAHPPEGRCPEETLERPASRWVELAGKAARSR